MLTSASRKLRPAGAFICLGLALLATLAAPAGALAGPTVKVRVEGESSTLLPLTEVTPEVPEPVSGCPTNSATTAINLAVKGNWDHGGAEGSKGDFTQTILGETHAFMHEGDTWAVWINDKWGSGICEDLLSTGDEVLLIADHEPAPYEPRVLPLVFGNLPTSVTAGASFNVLVDKIHTRPGTFPEIGEGTPMPEPGVVVAAGVYAAITGANGVATLTIPASGQYTLSARKPGDAPAAPVALCVRANGESGCGIQAPQESSTPATRTSSSPSVRPVTPYTGPYALVAKIGDLLDGHVYRHGRAPRLLEGTIVAHNTVTSVSLKLRRRFRGRCFAFEGGSARFVSARCGHGRFFQVSTSSVFSYLLPEQLPRGRYVLDTQATDAVGNHTTLARGTSRIVFYVG